jgi:hypothetical protein
LAVLFHFGRISPPKIGRPFPQAGENAGGDNAGGDNSDY